MKTQTTNPPTVGYIQSAETCEHFLGKSIATLIAEGRKALADELAAA